VAASAQSLGDFNSLRVLEVEHKKRVKRVFEGVRGIKLRRGSFRREHRRADPGEVPNRSELWSRRNPQGGKLTARVRRGESRNPMNRQI
jgi:hypothetical protein